VSPESERPDTRIDEYLHLTLPLALRFVIVFRIEVDGTKRRENFQPLAMGDIFRKSRSDRLFLGFVTTDPARLFDQIVINGEVGMAAHRNV